jgi:hypothetical protein
MAAAQHSMATQILYQPLCRIASDIEQFRAIILVRKGRGELNQFAVFKTRDLLNPLFHKFDQQPRFRVGVEAEPAQGSP